MDLHIERIKGNEITVTGPKLGLIIGFSGTTEGDHTKFVGTMMRFAKEQLKCANPPADIFFQWKGKSFFIFDSDVKTLDKKMLNQLQNYAKNTKFGVVIDGVLMKKSTYNILVLNDQEAGVARIMDNLQTLIVYNIKK